MRHRQNHFQNWWNSFLWMVKINRNIFWVRSCWIHHKIVSQQTKTRRTPIIMDNYMGLQWSLLYIYIRTLVYHIYIVYIFDISLDCNRLEWKIAVAGDIGQTGRLLVDVPARRMPVLAHEHGTAERVFFRRRSVQKILAFYGFICLQPEFSRKLLDFD